MNRQHACFSFGGIVRRTSRRFALVLPLAAAFACLPLAARAGTIPSHGTITGTGLGTASVPVISTVNPNNDNQVGGGGSDNNISVPIKRFDNVGYIDIVFNVSQSDGVTEYKISESVDNDTGIFWSSYTMQLGFGAGAGFTISPAGDGLDFDAPSYDTLPTSGAFGSVATSEDQLDFFSGVHNLGLQVYDFRIDVPDGISMFTLRQFPTPVPEPGTLLLAGIGAMALAWIVRRRR